MNLRDGSVQLPRKRWVVVFEHLLNEQNATRTHILEFCHALGQSNQVVLIAQGDLDSVGRSDSFIYQQVRALRIWPNTLAAFLYSFQVFFKLWGTHRRHPIDAVYVRLRTFDFGPLLFSRLAGIPGILEINAAYFAEARMEVDAFPLWKRIPYLVLIHIRRTIIDWVGRYLASGIVTVTEDLAKYLAEEHGFSRHKTKVYPNGVNVSRFTPRDMDDCKRRVNLDCKTHYVGFVGNLAAWQGLSIFLEGFSVVLKGYPDWQSLIVGDGDERAALEKMAQALGIADRVVFVGQVPYEAVVDYINAFAFGVAPFALNARNAITNVSPLKVFEYLACGKPVLASDFSGIKFIRDRKVGELFEPNDVGDLVCQLRRLMALSPLERHAMGMRGRELVVREFSWDKIVAGIQEFAFASMV